MLIKWLSFIYSFASSSVVKVSGRISHFQGDISARPNSLEARKRPLLVFSRNHCAFFSSTSRVLKGTPTLKTASSASTCVFFLPRCWSAAVSTYTDAKRSYALSNKLTRVWASCKFFSTSSMSSGTAHPVGESADSSKGMSYNAPSILKNLSISKSDSFTWSHKL